MEKPARVYDWHQGPSAQPEMDECPLCHGEFPKDSIVEHVEACIEDYETKRAPPPAPAPVFSSPPAPYGGPGSYNLFGGPAPTNGSGQWRPPVQPFVPVQPSPSAPSTYYQNEKEEKQEKEPPNKEPPKKDVAGYFYREFSDIEREKEENERLFEEFLRQEKEAEEQRLRAVQAQQQQSDDFVCAFCRKGFAFGHPNAHFLDDCGHYACKPCVRGFAAPLIREKKLGELRCGDCRKPLTPVDLQATLAKDEYERYLDATLDNTVKDSNLFAQCPKLGCGFLVERVEIPSRANLTNSAEISYFKERFRFRCPQCSEDFCSSCRITPYHEGKTCQQYKDLQQRRKCRFCHEAAHGDRDVCSAKECLDKFSQACPKMLACGHQCCGVKGEATCLPCLHENCTKNSGLKQTGNDYCNICWVESLDSAPSIALQCGHVFHFNCVKKQLEGKWNSANIVFNFMECPLCQHPVDHAMLQATLAPLVALKTDIQDKAMQRLKFLNLENVNEIAKDANGPYYHKPLSYAMKRFCYYQCYKCQKPYFGGERSCNAEQRAEAYNPAELVCAKCSGAGAGSECKIHKSDYLAWKCKFCCEVAVWFCWGNTHFCETCHKNHATVTKEPREKLPKCNCKIKHPPNGEEYCIGCSLCVLEPKDF